MKDITTFLFDVDGTLIDTGEFILQAVEHTLEKHGYPKKNRIEISQHVGKSMPDFYFALTGSRDNIEKLIDTHRGFQYLNYNLAKIFPGTLETLQALKSKGYKLGAVTTRSQKTSHQTLKDAGIFDLFEIVISGEDASELKPHPAPLFKALEHIDEKANHAIMIGDSHLDIQAGKNAGVKTGRVTYGFHKDKLHDPEPDFFIDDISDLLKLL